MLITKKKKRKEKQGKISSNSSHKIQRKYGGNLYTRTRNFSLRKADVSPRSSPLRDVSQGGSSATQRAKFHTDDVNQCLINPVVKGFQMQICSILRFSWSNLEKCCVHLRMSSSKTQMLLLEKTIFHKYWLFCQRFIAFTFDLFRLLSFVCHS